MISRAARLIRSEDIQIVHAHHGRDIWPAILAARLSGRRPKIVISRHMAKSPSSWFSRRFLLKNCDAVVAVSKFVQRVLCEGVYEPETDDPERRARPPLQGDRNKIHVIYGGIDTRTFVPDENIRRAGVLFAGRLLPHKGVDVLINAMDPDVPLRIRTVSLAPTGATITATIDASALGG